MIQAEAPRKTRAIRRRDIALSLFLLGASLLLRFLSRAVPGFADAYASRMNPLLVNTFGRFSGLFPFSLEEGMILLLLPLLCLLRRRRCLLRGLLLLLPLLFFLFELNEDVYFSRTPFAEQIGMRAASYETEDLEAVCLHLTDIVNETAPLVGRDSRGLMITGPDPGTRMRSAMRKLGERYAPLKGYYPRPKPVFFSRILTLCNFTGFYSMIPVEANYNREMPPYNIPFTMGHELAHLKGITSEQEANFIGYLSCIDSAEPDLRYSGAMLGWIYCTNELYARDRGRYLALRETLCPEANLDLDFNSAFWDSHEGAVSETAESLNDSFLKSEGLTEGVRSYDLVVDLIVQTELPNLR